MITDPRFAPRRTDLPFLRRRSRPKARSAEPASSTPAAVAPTTKAAISFDRPDRHQSPPPAPPAAPASPTTPAISFDRPDRHHDAPAAAASPPKPPAPASASLDLDAPSAPSAPPVSPPPSAPSASSASLDLDAPAPPAASSPSTPASASLDLDDAPAPPPPPARPSYAPPRRVRTDLRVRPGTRTILTPTEPTVTLTRLQSAIGTLTIEAACSDEVGDLRLGCAYQLASGASATVQMTQGNRFAPPHSRRPVIVAGHERYERIALDLRQCHDLQRLAVYAFSEGRKPLAWGGTLIATTFGAARIELPLETLVGGQVAVLLSLYNVHGEFVLRAEMQTLNGDVREASRAYGYDRITWLDDRSPVE